MKTIQTQLSIENQATKQLFQHLILFQFQLESREESTFHRDQELEEIILVIDQLLEHLINFYNREKIE